MLDSRDRRYVQDQISTAIAAHEKAAIGLSIPLFLIAIVLGFAIAYILKP